MIIPIRCFTCGKLLADKEGAYLEYIKYFRDQDQLSQSSVPHAQPTHLPMILTPVEIQQMQQTPQLYQTPEYKALALLKLNDICCRKTMLSYVDLTDSI